MPDTPEKEKPRSSGLPEGFSEFDGLARKLISVPKEEIVAMEKAEKAKKRRKRKKKS